MLEQVQLSEELQVLLKAQRQALAQYTAMCQGVGDPQMAEQIQQLVREKQRHVQLAERLLEIIDDSAW